MEITKGNYQGKLLREITKGNTIYNSHMTKHYKQGNFVLNISTWSEMEGSKYVVSKFFGFLFSIIKIILFSFFFILSQYIRKKMKATKSIVLKYNMKNLVTKLLPTVKKQETKR